MHEKLQTTLTDFNAQLAQFTTMPRKPKSERLNVEAIVTDHLSTDAHVFFDNGYIASAEIDEDGTTLVIKVRI